MKSITNPPPPVLGPGAAPEELGNLQDALLFLIEKERSRLPEDRRRELEEALRRDRNLQAYGNSTGNVIIAVREQFQLEPGEVVDEPTAAILNRELRELGAFDAQRQLTTSIVGGQVRREDGLGWSALRVCAAHETNPGRILKQIGVRVEFRLAPYVVHTSHDGATWVL
jgi:hypothetical protein